MESLTLTTAGSIPSYRVIKLALDWQLLTILIVLLDPNGHTIACKYVGAIALTLMTQLNKMDLSTTSLHKRILERLVTDGKLPSGTVTGSPD